MYYKAYSTQHYLDYYNSLELDSWFVGTVIDTTIETNV